MAGKCIANARQRDVGAYTASVTVPTREDTADVASSYERSLSRAIVPATLTPDQGDGVNAGADRRADVRHGARVIPGRPGKILIVRCIANDYTQLCAGDPVDGQGRRPHRRPQRHAGRGRAGHLHPAPPGTEGPRRDRARVRDHRRGTAPAGRPRLVDRRPGLRGHGPGHDRCRAPGLPAEGRVTR